MIQSARIGGVLAPVVTPFKPDLSPDPERLIRHCKWLLQQNCGLAVFGTNSEANSLAAEEREALLDALVAAGIDPSRMMPGTGCCSFTETVELTAHAVKNGCAGVLMLPPFYYKNVSEEGLYRYFSEVVQRVGDPRLKIYLYHIPPVAVVGITPKLVERLLKAYPNAIAGMKDSSGDWNNTKVFLDAFAETGFEVFVGSESFLLANMRNGGVGTISATANVNPAAIYKLYAASKDKLDRINKINRIESDPVHLDPRSPEQAWRQRCGASSPRPTARLEDLHAQLNVVREVFARKSWPSMIAALKQAIAIYREDPEWTRVRPPLVELTTEQTKMLRADLEAIGFAM
jgi:4-hydroxy-tetrahydrodipicolinate synthase